jgi:hypothetical protein
MRLDKIEEKVLRHGCSSWMLRCLGFGAQDEGNETRLQSPGELKQHVLYRGR